MNDKDSKQLPDVRADSPLVLAGDIGGSKTELALFSIEAGPRAPLAQAKYPSRDYPSLVAIVREFLALTSRHVERAYFGVAGPVIDDAAKTTNLPWLIEESNLIKQFGLKSVNLLNDLEATAAAVPLLVAQELHTLHHGEAVLHGAIAVIAPGTGLGEAFLVWDDLGYTAYPSEGGHAGFAPSDAQQIALLESLRREFDHVSCERVCSGNGMPLLYEFLRQKKVAQEWDEVADAIRTADDKARVIIDAALDTERPSPLCRATLELFAAILGAEAGNLALKTLATGGVYFGGGIPINILPVLEQEAFLRAFQSKGRFSDLLARIPVHVMPADAALMGVAARGLALAQRAQAHEK